MDIFRQEDKCRANSLNGYNKLWNNSSCPMKSKLRLVSKLIPNQLDYEVVSDIFTNDMQVSLQ